MNLIKSKQRSVLIMRFACTQMKPDYRNIFSAKAQFHSSYLNFIVSLYFVYTALVYVYLHIVDVFMHNL